MSARIAFETQFGPDNSIFRGIIDTETSPVLNRIVSSVKAVGSTCVDDND